MGKPILGNIAKSMLPELLLRTKCIFFFPNEQDYFPKRIFQQLNLKKSADCQSQFFGFGFESKYSKWLLSWGVRTTLLSGKGPNCFTANSIARII